MSAALQYASPDPAAVARARYRAELAEIVDELADELGYTPGALFDAAQKAPSSEPEDLSHLLVVARILA